MYQHLSSLACKVSFRNWDFHGLLCDPGERFLHNGWEKHPGTHETVILFCVTLENRCNGALILLFVSRGEHQVHRNNIILKAISII